MVAIGIITVIVGIVYYSKKTGNVFYMVNRIGYIATAAFALGILLIYANGNHISVVSILLMIISLAVSVITSLKMTNQEL